MKIKHTEKILTEGFATFGTTKGFQRHILLINLWCWPKVIGICRLACQMPLIILHYDKNSMINKRQKKKILLLLQNYTRKRLRAGIGLPGRANNFSTPPVSFQCIKRLVGGARSKVVTISDVSDSCAFISSPDMFLTSSTTSFRFLLCRAHPMELKKFS